MTWTWIWGEAAGFSRFSKSAFSSVSRGSLGVICGGGSPVNQRGVDAYIDVDSNQKIVSSSTDVNNGTQGEIQSRCDDINNGQESESLVGLDRVINANAGRGEIVSTLRH